MIRYTCIHIYIYICIFMVLFIDAHVAVFMPEVAMCLSTDPSSQTVTIAAPGSTKVMKLSTRKASRKAKCAQSASRF